ncbi:galactose-1-phosphate uridylyltransferase [Patescibacteria group bacterium]|nr:galactose-1-phosphate uridylyltransferase [Patescibacteria group bacterium]
MSIKNIFSKNKSEYRKDYLLDRYVLITPGRAKRPRDVVEQTILKRNESCAFCLENIVHKNIVDSIGGKVWDVLSVKNIFPAVTIGNSSAYGVQEVIIDTPDHNKELADLSVAHIEKVLKMYAKRTAELSKRKKIEYIECFKNQGSKAGASLTHAHSQVFATNVIPTLLKEEYNLIQDHKKKHNHCPYCETIKKELKSTRKIFEDKHIAVFSPYASAYHYEAWILTKKHVDNISQITNVEIKSIALALKNLLLKMQSLDMSFNMFMHEVVSFRDQHFYIKIQPRESVWAGVELGSGIIINSVSPELAAKFYRS